MPGEEARTGIGFWSGTSFAAPQALSLAVRGVDLPGGSPADPSAVFDFEWQDASGTPRTGKTFCEDGSGFEPRLPGLVYQ